MTADQLQLCPPGLDLDGDGDVITDERYLAAYMVEPTPEENHG